MSTGNKGRRTASNSGAHAPPSAAPLARLNELLADALKAAKAVKPARKDGPSIKIAHRLANSLLKALPVDVDVESIAYQEHKASLEKAIKALQKDVNKVWKDGWEQHGEMEQDVGEQIAEWLPDIWRQMPENDMDGKLIQQALALCSSTVKSIEKIQSRAEFEDSSFKAIIFNGDDKKIFDDDDHLNYLLAWMWRELLVFAAAQNKPTKAIIADVKRFKMANRVVDFIRRPGEDESQYYKFWDAHWSGDMKDNAVQLRKDLSLESNRDRMK